jgi:hypothetical protein
MAVANNNQKVALTVYAAKIEASARSSVSSLAA